MRGCWGWGTATIADKATAKQGNMNYGEGVGWIQEAANHTIRCSRETGVTDVQASRRAGKPPTNTAKLVPKPGVTPVHCNAVG